MPQYDWKCEKCGRKVYVLSTIEERDIPPAKIVVEECDHEWKRVIGPTSFQLQGGGWYRDGY